jgi:hypothetical protein
LKLKVISPVRCASILDAKRLNAEMTVNMRKAASGHIDATELLDHRRLAKNRAGVADMFQASSSLS